MLYRQKESKGRIPTRLEIGTTESNDVMLFFNIFQCVYKNSNLFGCSHYGPNREHRKILNLLPNLVAWGGVVVKALRY
jgi:hypothetical protein